MRFTSDIEVCLSFGLLKKHHSARVFFSRFKKNLKSGLEIYLMTLLFVGAFSSNLFSSQRIVAQDGSAGRRFGYSVSIDGNWMAVGAPGLAQNDGYKGAVYIYTMSNSQWSFHSLVTAADNQSFNFFGSSVSLYKEWLLVGAHADTSHGSYSGSAYLFQRVNNAYVQRAVFRSSHASDLFGSSAAMGDGFCVVGARAAGGSPSGAGAVYVYRQNGSNPTDWIADGTLTAADGKANNAFGAAVAVSGNRVLVGAPFTKASPASAGTAYIFEKVSGTWTQKAKLAPVNGSARNLFGSAVDIDGDWAVIGAYREDNKYFDDGSVYVYRLSSSAWSLDVELTAADADSGDFFGCSVALKNSFLIVGAPGDNGTYRDSGSIYAFLRTGGSWVMTTKKGPVDARDFDRFGSAVDIGPNAAAAGAPTKAVGSQAMQGVLFAYKTLDDLELAVTLTSFQAVFVDGGVLLTWKVQSEIDNLGFIIQRRTETSDWETVADFQTHEELLGRGGASSAADYRFFDFTAAPGTDYYYRLGDVRLNGEITFHEPVRVQTSSRTAVLAPEGFRLHPPFPNPFNSRTAVLLELTRPMKLEATVYDLRGRRVRQLISERKESGSHTLAWDGSDDSGKEVAGGVYLLRIRAEEAVAAYKVVLIK